MVNSSLELGGVVPLQQVVLPEVLRGSSEVRRVGLVVLTSTGTPGLHAARVAHERPLGAQYLRPRRVAHVGI